MLQRKGIFGLGRRRCPFPVPMAVCNTKKQNDCKTAKELADEYMEDWDNWKWKNHLLDSIRPPGD